MEFVIAALLLASVQAASLEFNRCSEGPSYKCSSIETASLCQSFKYCLDTKWKTQFLDVQQTKTCNFSQKVVKTVRRGIVNNNKHREGVHLIASMCTFAHDDITRKKCKDVVTNFLPEIFRLVESDLEPTSVATLMGLCKPNNDSAKNEKPDEDGGLYYAASSNTTYCNECMQFFANVRAILGNSVSVRPDKVCSHLRVCPKMMETSKLDFANIFNVAWEKKLSGNIDCDKCKAFVLSGRTSETIPSMQTILMEAFRIICSKLGYENKKCKDLFQLYSPGLIEVMASLTDSSVVCDNLLNCTKPENREEATQDTGTQTLMDTDPKIQGMQVAEETSAVSCSLCETIVAQADTILKENITKAMFRQVLDDICKALPDSITPQCLSFVDEYASVVLDLLVQEELEPHKVCYFLGLCKSAAATGPRLMPVPDSMADSLECELCKVIITEINNFIGDNKTEAALIHVVEKVCDIVTGDLRLQCISEVQNYGPAVLDLLQHMDDPTQVCSYLHLCESTNDSVLAGDTAGHGKHKMMGSEVCAYGPDFICATMENARICKMEPECVEKYGLKP